MKNNIYIIAISVILSVTLSYFLGGGLKLGSAIISTNSSDTLETFRTNVNTSLTSLQSFASTTNFVGLLASTSPYGSLSIEQSTETASVWIGNQGSTTPSLVVNGVNGNGFIGLASSSPAFNLSLGATSATTTVGRGFYCEYASDEAGRKMWIKLATSGSSAFATSTTPCK